ncbi:MAG TPA: ElyC/SanA/YdcF family protein [Verrucomicrobiales bacterium]|nr:ElyC/SanA/YdcF family protein [Verrucomicrobiales bacterium]
MSKGVLYAISLLKQVVVLLLRCMDLWFSLKKLLSIYINPVSITLELLFLGLVLISFSRRRSKNPPGPRGLRVRRFLGSTGVFLVGLGMLTIFLCSVDPVANGLTLYLEGQNPPLPEKEGVPIVKTPPAFIVVLAGGHRSVPDKPTLSRLSHHGLARIVGAVDLWKQFPESQFVVTGNPTETSAMRVIAERLGVPTDRLLEESESRDTKDHPVKLKPIIGESPFLLVTSAVHMPRAVSLFRKQGFDPIVAPVDFLIYPEPGEYDPYRTGLLLPRVSNLQLTATALHEIGGMAWSKWREEVEE